MVKEFYWELDN